MSDISKLSVNGIIYNIKDAVARASGGGGCNIITITYADFENSTSYDLKKHCTENSYNIFIVSGDSGSISDYCYLDFNGVTSNMCGCILLLPDTYDESLGGSWIAYQNVNNLATITATAKDQSKTFLLTWFFGTYTVSTTAWN